ncbi:dihydrofolate reductase [Flavobacterium columnare]|uniref:Dihydrofolate reductase n=2 Tax=Flavobacterium columnare TaxID=996 RepID=G8X6R3_FLACA|nr:dihydrofolate reductase [Flavobacterium columnare]AEW85648.1 dihydrofolate reductase [Flavobacterium columnare ATCC 49512]AMO20889.1 dihydrofolate reductase [Flavobacterium columnare]ANO47417.1 dihydrofolate reductase [Flavobacterium columnare]APT21931.1 diacylglycerol kinase [Flavobacterium columnare]AUX18881.1 diacylglycerol kinase [Flavobacterium columnare]
MPKKIILIAAAGQNNELGKNNNLLWHLPNDFKHFKTLTSGHCIIMGRKTFESFSKPLPNRTHIIITRKKEYAVPEECIVVHYLEEALQACPVDQEVYVIGGGEIYRQFIDLADQIELTRVHGCFEADTFFPDIDQDKWELKESIFYSKDEKHLYSFSIEKYVKI